MMNAPIVICFGEVLWDIFPDKKIAGGAPMNVACHLHNLGLQTLIVSSVGKDAEGRELLEFLHTKGINTDFTEINAEHPTGTVIVQLDDNGVPAYEIANPAAWDFITFETEDLKLFKEAQAVIYGSLAARSEVSGKALMQLLSVSNLKVFDLNLRKPFYSKQLIEELLHQADLIKLSDGELLEILSWDSRSDRGDIRLKLETIRSKFSLQGILYTRGKDGAIFLDDRHCYSHGSFPVQVVDTVGSGDAFLSAFIKNFLQEEAPAVCLKNACAMGALVATRQGGTPTIDQKALNNFINQYQ